MCSLRHRNHTNNLRDRSGRAPSATARVTAKRPNLSALAMCRHVRGHALPAAEGAAALGFSAALLHHAQKSAHVYANCSTSLCNLVSSLTFLCCVQAHVRACATRSRRRWPSSITPKPALGPTMQTSASRSSLTSWLPTSEMTHASCTTGKRRACSKARLQCTLLKSVLGVCSTGVLHEKQCVGR